jgi:hypothetical protein
MGELIRQSLTAEAHQAGAKSMHSITGKSSQPIDYDRLIEAIRELHPGTEIVHRDWYAARHAEEVALCERRGWPMDFPPLVSLRDCWAEVGVQRAIMIPVHEDLILYARLDKRNVCCFRISGTMKLRNVLPLINLLERSGVELTVD